ncbi:hypothetical protein MLD38_028297 [Melastoma candidum]|uniref:Uncharacterized protein n=1 Tax=Melastoma candidum TaxID=119954 RepID=A0ACB9N2U6_9MYRT|nr:hypothetical protein MLD38_028297 [Melastoma candidum]
MQRTKFPSPIGANSENGSIELCPDHGLELEEGSQSLRLSSKEVDPGLGISSNEYEPSEMDILFMEGVTPSNGLSFIELSFDERNPSSELYSNNFACPPPMTRYQLIRINTKGLQYGCKWLDMFEDVRAVIFCVALSDYDQMYSNGVGPPHNKIPTPTTRPSPSRPTTSVDDAFRYVREVLKWDDEKEAHMDRLAGEDSYHSSSEMSSSPYIRPE